jgi:hypothetical protein
MLSPRGVGGSDGDGDGDDVGHTIAIDEGMIPTSKRKTTTTKGKRVSKS